ncbi:MAG: DNA polymerase III subunit [Acidobacteria bacterium]|nr:DNA polymerase III subunit [Acidobacteriota bacterium]
MSFATLIGNQHQKTILQRLLRGGQIATTFIFAGPDGVGKRRFALTMAKAANCLTGAPAEGFADDCCDFCQVCCRIDEGTYGDVTTIEPDGQFIKIAQTRELAVEVFYRPREGRHRFFIIDSAERLREEAANSLLKTLEEPPPTSTIIMITSRPDSLLTTIRSRSQKLNFSPLTTGEMEAYLKANFPRPAPDTALLARISEGRIGQATAFDLSVYRQQRRTLIELLEILSDGNNRYRLLKAAEFLGKKERNEFEDELDLLSSLLRDLFILSTGKSIDSIVNIDVAESLRNLAAKVGTDRLILWAEKTDRLRAGLRINLNRQLALESLLLDLAQTA